MKKNYLSCVLMGTLLWASSGCKKEIRPAAPPERSSGTKALTLSTTPVKGDVDGDGKADLVTFHTNGNVYTYRSDSGGLFTAGIPCFNGTMNSAIYDNTGHLAIDVTDVNGDGRSDIVTANTDGTIYVYTGKTDGTFNNPIGSFNGTYDPGFDGTTGYWPIAVGDINGDGRGDLVSERDGSIIVHPGNADATFGLAVFSFNGSFNSAMRDATGHYTVDVGDVNGDGLADLVTINTDGNAYTYLGQSNYTFGNPIASFSGTMKLGLMDGTGHEPVGLADVNGDGRVDLVTHHSNGMAYVYPGQADGTFSAGVASFGGGMASSIYKGAGHEVACVMDVTGDGYADLVTAHTNNNVYVYPGQSNGQFGNVVVNFGTFYSSRFGVSPGHEIVMEKSMIRRRGTLLRQYFKNPMVTTSWDNPDPFVTEKDGFYYFTYSQDSRIGIRKAKHASLFGISSEPNVWTTAGSGLSQVWAPELHYLNGSWYVYFTATPDGTDFGHRMYYMRNTDTDTDPTTGGWTAPVQIGGGPNYYSIDGTILTASNGSGALWFIWCGRKYSGDASRLYISRMSGPTALTGAAVMISEPYYSWETQGYPVNEGPAMLREAPGGLTYVVYSASAADQPTGYCLGLLSLRAGGDPMVASDWTKRSTPIFSSSSANAVYSPGHCSFFTSSYVNSAGTSLKQHWIVYHAKATNNLGYSGRTARMQSFSWDAAHAPVLGTPVGLSANVAVPKSEHFN
ncbi:family 43 glycosylhydrolase [Niabella sp.]|uniref:family 43 glycosylhydrolase n=1 Tax=Niabella sp. TaxID=1962976 RepID=UPI00263706D3|nr:family 43 glycosylhydrolase [Niabella sp.]